MTQNPLSINSSWNGKEFLSKLIRDKNSRDGFRSEFHEKKRFLHGILAHKSRTRYGNDSKPLPFYAEFICRHFYTNPKFAGLIPFSKMFIPFSVWTEEVSKTQISIYYDKIVKNVTMVICIPNWTQTLL